MFAIDKRYLSYHRRLLFWLYALFLTGYFVYPSAPDHYKFYYFLVLIPSLVLWPAKSQYLLGNKLFLLILIYCVYMVSSSFWSPVFNWSAFIKVVWHAFLVVSFVVVTAVVRDDYTDDFDSLLRALVVLAALVGAVSIVVWYSQHPFPVTRMKPVGRMEWEIRAASVYGFFGILSLYYLRISRRWAKWGYALAGLVIFFTVLFTQSRTALVAMLAAGVFLLDRRIYKWLFAVLLLAGLLFLAMPELWEPFTRDVYRLAIWMAVLEEARENPVFGTGYLSDHKVFADGIYFAHPHNAFLTALHDGGVVGLGLLVATFAVAVGWAIRLARWSGNNIHVVMLAYAFVSALPNPERLLTRPREQWLFLLLPIILVMVDYQRLHRREA